MPGFITNWKGGSIAGRLFFLNTLWPNSVAFLKAIGKISCSCHRGAKNHWDRTNQMKKFVVAGMLCLATVAGVGQSANASSLFGLHFGNKTASQAPAQAPVVNVQAGGAEVRIQQLEDQLRQLNGRIEEMSFQLLQMQETIRKAQEDNEFRFQELEKSGGGGGSAGGASKPMKKSEADIPASNQTAQGQGMGQGQGMAQGGGDDVARAIQTSRAPETSPSTDVPENTGLGQPPQQLGSMQFDQNGNPIGGSVNPGAEVGSSPLPPVGAAGSQTASLGSEADQYKAAYGHVLSGDYSTAEKEFNAYIGQYPNSARGRRQFLAGRSALFAGQVQRIGQDLPERAPEVRHVGKGAGNASEARHVARRARQYGNRLRNAARSAEALSQGFPRRHIQGRE